MLLPDFNSSIILPKGDTSAESGSGGCVGVGAGAAGSAAGAAASAASVDSAAGGAGDSLSTTTTNVDLASSNDYLVPSSKASSPPRRYTVTEVACTCLEIIRTPQSA